MFLWCYDRREALLFGEQRWSVDKIIPKSRNTKATTTSGKGCDVLDYMLSVPVGLIDCENTILSGASIFTLVYLGSLQHQTDIELLASTSTLLWNFRFVLSG